MPQTPDTLGFIGSQNGEAACTSVTDACTSVTNACTPVTALSILACTSVTLLFGFDERAA